MLCCKRKRKIRRCAFAEAAQPNANVLEQETVPQFVSQVLIAGSTSINPSISWCTQPHDHVEALDHRHILRCDCPESHGTHSSNLTDTPTLICVCPDVLCAAGY